MWGLFCFDLVLIFLKPDLVLVLESGCLGCYNFLQCVDKGIADGQCAVVWQWQREKWWSQDLSGVRIWVSLWSSLTVCTARLVAALTWPV